MVDAAKACEVCKEIISSKNVANTIWNIINKKDRPFKKITVKTGGMLLESAIEVADEFHRFFAPVAWRRDPRQSLPQVSFT